jgi:hypothetical protein
MSAKGASAAICLSCKKYNSGVCVFPVTFQAYKKLVAEYETLPAWRMWERERLLNLRSVEMERLQKMIDTCPKN